MDIHTTDIDPIIAHYLDETITPDEKRYLLEWLKADDENLKYFSEIREIWLMAQASPNKRSAKDSFCKFKERVMTEGVRKRGHLYPILKWAVSVAAFLTLLLGNIYFLNQPVEKLYVEVPKVFCKVMMPVGSKGSVVLPDSSVVWLRSGSTLIYPEHFEANCRNVKLSGEGYFEVKRNPSAPFHVEAKQMLITVLGTTFNIKGYENDEVVETVLLTGAVDVKVNNKHLYHLVPNQKISFNRRNEQVSVNKVNGSDYNSWKDECLVFDNASLGDVIRKLENWYQVEFSCPESLRSTVRLSFTVCDESKEEILKLMMRIAPIKYAVRADHKIEIYSRISRDTNHLVKP